MWDWSSKTKYEGAFLGHTFVARRADDPSVIVDKFTLEPTRIIDCPRNQKQKTQKVLATADIDDDVGGNCPNPDDEDQDDHNEDDHNNGNNNMVLAPPGEGLPRWGFSGAFDGTK